MIENILSDISCPELSLYVHIPFCLKRCFYCDFYSSTDVDGMDLYVKRLVEEIRSLAAINTVWKSVYIGGGTPNYLGLDSLERLLAAIAETTGSELEWTIECNPEFITSSQLMLFDRYGVNRISLGVQSLDDSLLALLGRRAKSDYIKRAFLLIEDLWEKDISVDILANRPVLYADKLICDIEWFVNKAVPHMSIYGLTVEKDTVLHKMTRENIVKFDEDYASQEWFDILRLLKESGYINYEISNFAFPGKESVHNLRYWQLKPYIGLGASAVSTVNNKDVVIRVEGDRSVSAYCDGHKDFYRIEAISPADFMFEFFMMGFRTSLGIDIKRFKRIWGREPDFFLGELGKRLFAREQLVRQDGMLFLSSDARVILNTILVDVLNELSGGGDIPQPAWP